uniref:RIBOSOMAL PROTEIN L2 n=2 Tax=Haloarcula marismortui TaxID=2238 RepID=UPI0000111611|nr:Chain A, RIBOSOMAL PROTEIN L2 [Haloarcula marismortui]1JJ2_A Chain A, Ribosomal Protein L2 [Haloarcula marismortui]1K73_C Chain C, RIBOSOMAL PROTEIN L2 [Haloarcula marismortui]1K8A_C Chain C, RIBOSOMAL PROTEIN L2 [Haloarcula marismortui]1K9M_C Chain C, RIBOSOMAL PROTEIN L2 [Haloarcula marismortui]1KC8_C Chain C, RIBOSOMAL PROTEIN L2 [Haloarcula marismortui]1KD1_C Chain C, RIBOSOMAL PROTEIN L2 [Haloarcula marismortui]1KQS_A Chain A, RIBOSOMAL PROTEIN L2 [Haloarcula marismortui]1M1K_C Chai
GRRIQGQRRGRGTSTFRAPSHRYKADLEHRKVEDGDVIAGTVVDIEHDPARSAPVAAVEFEDGDRRLILAPEGVGVGDELQVGVDAEIAPGNTLPLAEIPEGVPVCNVESSPGDGGKFARASGVNAQLLTHDRNVAVVKLPSGEMKRLDPQCRATIGVVGGGGRTDKPFVKAGNKHHKMKARGTKWPNVRGVAMNAVDHPFGGGGRQHPGKPKSISRNAPPGRKVGDIASKRTGRGGNE